LNFQGGSIVDHYPLNPKSQEFLLIFSLKCETFTLIKQQITYQPNEDS